MSREVYRGPRKSGLVVRSGRRGRELRIDGTLASWYRPGSPATGSVWDALAAGLLALPSRRRRTVLILGLGGASVARALRALAPRAALVGVEIDREVVRAARRWFDLDEIGVEVRVEDARAALARETRRFDLVIEDVFVGRGRAVRKPPWLPEPGLPDAARLLRPRGVLVCNALDEAPQVRRTLMRLYDGLLRIDIDDYDNRVFVAGNALPSASDLRARIRSSPVLAPTLPSLTIRNASPSKPEGRAVS